MKIKANTIKEITSIKIKGADAMHSLDTVSYTHLTLPTT